MQEPPGRSELAELMNKARQEQGVSIRHAAAAAGVPVSTVHGWLTGDHFPTPALRPKFEKLVEHLGLAAVLHPGLWQDEL